MQSEQLLDLEQSILSLNHKNQQWLLRRISEHVQRNLDRSSLQDQIANMADDPEIQAELATIQQDLALAEVEYP